MDMQEEIARIIEAEIGGIHVGRNGSCRWTDVANVQTRVLAQVRALSPAQEWQDISTAPKDGTVFIYQDCDGAVSTCSWQANDCGFDWYDIHHDQTAYPLRWVHLPAAALIAEKRTTK